MSFHRLTMRQRAWLPMTVVRVFGPLGVDAGALRAALARLHQMCPARPEVCVLDRDRGKWGVLDPAAFQARLPGAVIEPAAGASPDTFAHAMLALDLGDRPMVLGVRGGFVAMKSNHAIGDASTLIRLLGWLVEAARHPAADPPVTPTARAPLVRAMMRHYLRDPTRLARALMPGARAGASVESDVRPWRPAPALAFSRSEASLMPRLRAWREAAMPGVSIGSILAAAVIAAFDQEGLPVDRTGLVVLVDGRRYLVAGRALCGNYAVGQVVSPAVADPVEIHTMVRARLDSGRPLLAIGLGDLRGLRARAATVEDWAPIRPRARITVNHIGTPGVLERLPWSADDDDRTLISAPTPSGPSGITVTSLEHAGALHLTASFHATTFAREAVARALDRVCADPQGTLRPASRRGARAHSI